LHFNTLQRKMQHDGERRKLSLDTSVKAATRIKARDTYLSILANGWEETLKTLRPERPGKTELTIGQFWLS
jgi:hypothetical protein